MSVVLHETEAAGCLLKAIQPHDQALDLSALREEFVYLFFRCVEGEIAYIEGRSILEGIFLLLILLVSVRVVAALLLQRTLVVAQRGAHLQTFAEK